MEINQAELPYHEIIPDLLFSIKKAYAEFYSETSSSGLNFNVSHAKINSHFVWLSLEKSVTGSNSARHLFDAVRPLRPLARKAAQEIESGALYPKLTCKIIFLFWGSL